MPVTYRLPEGFVMRHPKMADLQEVYDLVHTCEMADDGMATHSLEDFRLTWEDEDFHLDTDAWVVFDPTGQPVAYADSEDREHVNVFAFIRILPEYRNQGIEQVLIRETEERAKQHIALAPAHARITVNDSISHTDTAFAQLLEQAGYEQVRSAWTMEIDMNEAPAKPVWPEGITVRPFVVERDERVVYEADDEAFRDHWGHIPIDFEQWKYWEMNREGFVPALSPLAFDGDELAGFILSRYDGKAGWVEVLAVRRPWRRQGLGLALLRHVFGAFYRQGTHKVGLSVDSQNLTGATRLYTSAGMHVVSQRDTYQKELRAGQELSIQSVSA